MLRLHSIMHLRILLLIALVLIEGTISFPLPRVHNPPVPVKRAILIQTPQCSTTPQVSTALLQELVNESCSLNDIASSCGSECDTIRSCSPASSTSDQSAGQLFEELKAKVDFYKNVAGREAPEVCRLDALLRQPELRAALSCSRGQYSQPSVSGADFPSWSQLSNASRSLCLLTAIQTSLLRLVTQLNPNNVQLTWQCNNIQPKIWQAEEMMHFTKFISEQMNQTNISCRTVNVTAAEAVTTLTNISILLGNSSLNCFSAELNRSIIPIIANLEPVQATPPSLDFGEKLDSEQLKFCLLKQVQIIMDEQLNRWNVNDNSCFRENYVSYRTEMSC